MSPLSRIASKFASIRQTLSSHSDLQSTKPPSQKNTSTWGRLGRKTPDPDWPDLQKLALELQTANRELQNLSRTTEDTHSQTVEAEVAQALSTYRNSLLAFNNKVNNTQRKWGLPTCTELNRKLGGEGDDRDTEDEDRGEGTGVVWTENGEGLSEVASQLLEAIIRNHKPCKNRR